MAVVSAFDLWCGAVRQRLCSVLSFSVIQHPTIQTQTRRSPGTWEMTLLFALFRVDNNCLVVSLARVSQCWHCGGNNLQFPTQRWQPAFVESECHRRRSQNHFFCVFGLSKVLLDGSKVPETVCQDPLKRLKSPRNRVLGPSWTAQKSQKSCARTLLDG